MRRRPTPLPAVALFAFVGATACLVALFAAAVIFIRPAVGDSAAGTSVTVGELRYSVENAWVLHPARSVDAKFAQGLPAGDTRLRRRELLYAVFVGVTNESDQPASMASDIALRDVRNREYAPVRLAPGNAFAYEPRVIPPKTHLPTRSTPAGRDPVAQGMMLVFRIPRPSYEDGPLELVVRDPADHDPASIHTVLTA